jgi:hypothetical protein
VAAAARVAEPHSEKFVCGSDEAEAVREDDVVANGGTRDSPLGLREVAGVAKAGFAADRGAECANSCGGHINWPVSSSQSISPLSG